MTFNYLDRIERDPRVAGGQAVIKGTRVTLRTVLASLAEGATIEEILRDFPTLTDVDVRPSSRLPRRQRRRISPSPRLSCGEDQARRESAASTSSARH